mgnify:CR=1 FL=1
MKVEEVLIIIIAFVIGFVLSGVLRSNNIVDSNVKLVKPKHTTELGIQCLNKVCNIRKPGEEFYSINNETECCDGFICDPAFIKHINTKKCVVDPDFIPAPTPPVVPRDDWTDESCLGVPCFNKNGESLKYPNVSKFGAVKEGLRGKSVCGNHGCVGHSIYAVNNGGCSPNPAITNCCDTSIDGCSSR